MESGLLADCDPFAVDTSFVVAALLPDQKRHDIAAAAMERLIEQQATMVFCEMIYMELMDCSVEIPLRPHQKRRYDKRVRRRAYPTIAGLSGGWFDLKAAVPHVSMCMDELWDMAGCLMDDYGLRSADAYHAGAAFLSNAPIFTFDTDFARVAGGLTVYTSSDLVPKCRRLRQRMRSYASEY
jgi:predicted nucleic acid-binding protein